MDSEKRKEAVSALIKIAALEAVILIAVVAAYLATGNLTYLIGGIIGAQIVAVPMFLRWTREHAPAMKQNPDKDHAGR
jgi:hypothetical protein